MATGGSGDVLTGIIVSLLSQGLEPLLATAAASFIHSEAGDIYAVKYGERTLTATGLIEMISC